jgi:hypothetical protein
LFFADSGCGFLSVFFALRFLVRFLERGKMRIDSIEPRGYDFSADQIFGRE